MKTPRTSFPSIPPESRLNINNSPPNLPKILQRRNEQETPILQRSTISNINRVNLNRDRSKLNCSSDLFVSLLATTNLSFFYERFIAILFLLFSECTQKN
jgi:hypothetical protein